MQNQTFSEMMKAALIPLNGRDPMDIARRTGFDWDGECFSFSSLGQALHLGWPGCAFCPEIEPWHQLVILHYMDGCAGVPASGKPIPFSAQPGGMVRGGGFDRDCEETVRSTLGNCAPEQLESACVQLGGRIVPSNADLCAVFDFLPRYPLTLKIWFADEEMDASGRMLLDECAPLNLSVEDSVTAGTLILDSLLNRIRQEDKQ